MLSKSGSKSKSKSGSKSGSKSKSLARAGTGAFIRPITYYPLPKNRHDSHVPYPIIGPPLLGPRPDPAVWESPGPLGAEPGGGPGRYHRPGGSQRCRQEHPVEAPRVCGTSRVRRDPVSGPARGSLFGPGPVPGHAVDPGALSSPAVGL